MQVGVALLGKVDDLDGEFVKTQFVLIGVPLLPLRSYYFSPDAEPVEIEVHPKSAWFGLLRFYSFAGAIGLAIGTILAFLTPGVGLLTALLATLGCGGLCTLWFFSMFCWGDLAEANRERRILFREVTGIGVEPDVVSTRAAHKMVAGLRRSWDKHHTNWGGRSDWKEAIVAGANRKTMGYLAVLASYQRRVKGDAGCGPDLEARAWALAEGREPPSSQSKASSSSSKSRARGKKGEVIKMACPSCEEISRIPGSYAGRMGRCPRCRAAVMIPAA